MFRYRELRGVSDDVIKQNFVPLTRSPCDSPDEPAVTGKGAAGDQYGSTPTVKRDSAAGAFPEIVAIRGRLFVNKTDLAAHDAAILAKITGTAVAS